MKGVMYNVDEYDCSFKWYKSEKIELIEKRINNRIVGV